MDLRRVGIVWAVLTPVILVAARPLSNASGLGYLTSVMALYGFLFMFTGWAFGKGSTVFAANLGQAAAGNLSAPSNAMAATALTSPTAPTPSHDTLDRRRMLLLRKQARSGGHLVPHTTSWLGGLPALGDQAWPRGASGTALHHLLQVDLSDAATKIDVPGLPTHGSLAFFASAGVDHDGEAEAAVVYVPDPAATTTPPPDLSPACDHTFGNLHSRGAADSDTAAFPRWDVELVAFATDAAVDDLGVRLRATFGADPSRVVSDDTMSALPNETMPSYWDSAQRFVRSVEAALGKTDNLAHLERTIAGYEETLASFAVDGVPEGANPDAMQTTIERSREQAEAMRTAHPELLERTKALRAWAFGRDQWSTMSADDVADLEAHFRPFIKSYPDSAERLWYRYTNQAFNSLEELAQETLRAMITGPAEVFALLPDAVQRSVDSYGLLTLPPHQMFGPGVEIQTAASDNDDKYLLMQVASDRLLGMGWGDAGVIQFWIAPDALAAQNWSQVTATFESH